MAVNVALVGAGGVSRAHLSALANSSTVKIVGIYDADTKRAQERATEFGIGHVYESWEALLADPNVRAVGVLLPPDLHQRFTVEALAAGKDVVCEKPMAATLAECDEMLAAAKRSGRQLFTVQNRIYSPAYEAMREHIMSGAIGTVFLAQTTGFEGPNTVWRSPWLATARGGNGVLMAQAVHPAYALRWMLGEVDQVSCTMGARKVIEMVEEDTAVVTLRFASGVIAAMTATFGLSNGPFDHSIGIFGSDGWLELHNQHGNPTQPQTLQMISPKVFGDRTIHQVELPPVPDHSSSFGQMWEDYANAMETGQPARRAGVDGRKAVEIILAAHRAAELNAAVKLPL